MMFLGCECGHNLFRIQFTPVGLRVECQACRTEAGMLIDRKEILAGET